MAATNRRIVDVILAFFFLLTMVNTKDSEQPEHLLVTGIYSSKTIISLTNNNIHSSLQVGVYGSGGHKEGELTLSKGEGKLETVADGANLTYTYFTKVAEYSRHASKQSIRHSIHDLSLLKFSFSAPWHSLSTHFMISPYDRVYYVHFPTTSGGGNQYLSISSSEKKPVEVRVQLPTLRQSLQQHRLVESYEKLQVIFSRSPTTPQSNGHLEYIVLGGTLSLYEKVECVQGDLTGTKIEGRHGISVVAGVIILPSPPPFWGGEDIMEEQLIPPTRHSTHYVIPSPHPAAPLLNKFEGIVYTMSVMAVKEKTTLKICSNITRTLPAGISIELELPSVGCIIKSNQPVSVVVYATFLLSERFDVRAGSAMTSILDNSLWSNSYAFTLPSESELSYYVILVVDEDHTKSLLHNEEILAIPVWKRVETGSYMTAMFHVLPGTHRLRMLLPHAKFSAYVMSVGNHSLGLSPAYVGKSKQHSTESCINTVSYTAETFGTADYIDNDCDGRIDEEICVGHYINSDEDKDGLYDEDCAGWSETSYMDICTSNDDCNAFGQLFKCVENLCQCSHQGPFRTGSSGWFYDNLDGLCWPARGYDIRGGQLYGIDNEECGASFYIRYVDGEEHCVCDSLTNPWHNNMSCYEPFGETFCKQYSHLCKPWQECVGTHVDFYCLEPHHCYGDRYMDCGDGLTCILEKGVPGCEDVADDCTDMFGNSVCPPQTMCKDKVGTFECETFTHPCHTATVKPCLPDFECYVLDSSSSYHCKHMSTDETIQSFVSISDSNTCIDTHLRVTSENGYICYAYTLCSLMDINHTCTSEQTCLLVNGGQICVPTSSLRIFDDIHQTPEWVGTQLLLVVSILILLGPLVCHVASARRVIEKSRNLQKVHQINADMNIVNKLGKKINASFTTMKAPKKKVAKKKKKDKDGKSVKKKPKSGRRSKQPKPEIYEAGLSLTDVESPSATSVAKKKSAVDQTRRLANRELKKRLKTSLEQSAKTNQVKIESTIPQSKSLTAEFLGGYQDFEASSTEASSTLGNIDSTLSSDESKLQTKANKLNSKTKKSSKYSPQSSKTMMLLNSDEKSSPSGRSVGKSEETLPMPGRVTSKKSMLSDIISVSSQQTFQVNSGFINSPAQPTASPTETLHIVPETEILFHNAASPQEVVSAKAKSKKESVKGRKKTHTRQGSARSTRSQSSNKSERSKPAQK